MLFYIYSTLTSNSMILHDIYLYITVQKLLKNSLFFYKLLPGKYRSNWLFFAVLTNVIIKTIFQFLSEL